MRKASLLLMVVLVVVAVWVYWQRANSPANILPAETIACADVGKGCLVDGIKLRFDHMPQVMKPFHLSAESANATEFHASFAMRGMEMGLNRYRLLKQANGLWTAEVVLPVCVRGRSDWLMLLEVQTPDGLKRYQLAFRTD